MNSIRPGVAEIVKVVERHLDQRLKSARNHYMTAHENPRVSRGAKPGVYNPRAARAAWLKTISGIGGSSLDACRDVAELLEQKHRAAFREWLDHSSQDTAGK